MKARRQYVLQLIGLLRTQNPRSRTPIDKEELSKEPLDPSGAAKYRAIVSRLNYLGQDGSEIQFAIKELGKEPSTPSHASWVKIK